MNMQHQRRLLSLAGIIGCVLIGGLGHVLADVGWFSARQEVVVPMTPRLMPVSWDGCFTDQPLPPSDEARNKSGSWTFGGKIQHVFWLHGIHGSMPGNLAILVCPSTQPNVGYVQAPRQPLSVDSPSSFKVVLGQSDIDSTFTLRIGEFTDKEVVMTERSVQQSTVIGVIAYESHSGTYTSKTACPPDWSPVEKPHPAGVSIKASSSDLVPVQIAARSTADTQLSAESQRSGSLVHSDTLPPLPATPPVIGGRDTDVLVVPKWAFDGGTWVVVGTILLILVLAVTSRKGGPPVIQVNRASGNAIVSAEITIPPTTKHSP